MSDDVWWYLMRSSGLTAWLMLTLTLVWGSIVSGRLAASPKTKRWLLDVHPFLGALGLSALGLHVVAAVADSQSKLDWLGVVVPFRDSFNPSAVAWGVVAVWLFAAVEITSLLRRHLGRRTWHQIHLASYVACWSIALHAAFAGTDLASPVVAWTALGLVAATTGVTVTRALGPGPRPAPARVGGRLTEV